MKKDFKNLVDTLRNSIKTWDYFVNWEKVFANCSELEIVLNKLNYLLGKEDLQSEFNRLYASNPDIVRAFPLLLAVREKRLEIFELVGDETETFDFETITPADVDKHFRFLVKTGLVRLFQKEGIKNLVDYVIGVEVGLDSNGRKNRGGTLMENIVETHIKKMCESRGFSYIAQARSTDIRNKWGVEVRVDKSERSFDFAVFNPENKKIKLFEVNFYNGGGSKLKAVCGEFKNLYDELKAQEIDFVWVTDGLGWHTTRRPLEETYNHNEYVFNLHMVERGILNDLNW